jgi:cytochrome oxidase Cu insertion factor (SCO1/SenC/PrrC family)
MPQPETRAAPDAEVILSDGRKTRLSDLWKEKTLLLIFIRYFG